VRAALAALLLAASPALAQPVPGTCARDMEQSERLIRGIQARDQNPGIARGDTAGLCRLLRRNEQDMATARGLQAPCLTGFERRETLAMFDANLIDIREAIARVCK
jgi:hypothetical protein